MGYTTNFSGQITIDPPLNAHEVEYLQKFNETRRMDRTSGPYFVEGTGFHGQGHDSDISDFNTPPDGQPGLWCQWEPTPDGTALQWDENEKFYSAEEWMAYLIDTFLSPGAWLEVELSKRIPGRQYPQELEYFTFDHRLNGIIEAQGEDPEDRWQLIVENNQVRRRNYVFHLEGS